MMGEGMANKNTALKNALKGLAVGASMTIPGVSGGTMAIILGIYDRLISAMANIAKKPRESLFLLSTFSIGGIAGILLLSKAILHITQTWRMPMLYLFMGAVLGSIPMLYRKAGLRSFTVRIFMYPIIGALLVLAISFLPADLLNLDESVGFWNYAALIFCGGIISVAFILPGLSTSYMLLVMGLYESVLSAIDNMDFMFLGLIAIGVIIGVILTTKLMSLLMDKHPQGTYLIIIGFVLVSLREIFPGIPVGWDIAACILTFIIGFSAILFMARRSR
ncbi:MAG: DUF368 domain-containing protein [Christensenellales bacterium]|jgi:putative membrane protein